MFLLGGKKLSLTFRAQLGASLREAVLGAVSLSGGIAERPDTAADVLQRHFGGPCLGSGRQCWGRRAVAAVSVLGEAMSTSAEKLTVQRPLGFIFLSVCPGERRSTDKQGSGRWQ